MPLQDLGLDISVGPDCIKEFLLGRKASGMIHQIAEDSKRFWLHQNAFLAAMTVMLPQALVFSVQPERIELLHVRAHDAGEPDVARDRLSDTRIPDPKFGKERMMAVLIIGPFTLLINCVIGHG